MWSGVQFLAAALLPRVATSTIFLKCLKESVMSLISCLRAHVFNCEFVILFFCIFSKMTKFYVASWGMNQFFGVLCFR